VSKSFADLGVPAELVSALTARGVTQPFPIQTATLEQALAGRDLCGRAPTGSGKTLAFGIALAARVGRANPGAPRGLVLVPTRELAEQVRAELAPLCAARKRTITTLYGGVGFEPQRKALRRGVDVIVACPGRLADLLKQGDVRLGEVDFVVVDEADRMADMGFLPEVRRLLDRTHPKRQTLLYSATLDGDVDVLVRRYQRDPARHEVEQERDSLTLAEHRFLAVGRNDRVSVCARLIAELGSSVVFVRTKHGADRVAKQLAREGVRAAVIHGGRSQNQRDRALESFHKGAVSTLVATDVAARGIHVEGVGGVVHFDLPGDEKDYVHRSGRTARAGATGVVVSLVLPDQVAEVRKLQAVLGLPQGLGRAEAGERSPKAPILVEEREYPRPESRPAQRAAPQKPRERSRGPARPTRGLAPWKKPDFESDAPRGPRAEWGAGIEERAARAQREQIERGGVSAERITHEPVPRKPKRPAWHRPGTPSNGRAGTPAAKRKPQGGARRGNGRARSGR
jgi:superfamily II DNA/RNA helicase